MPSILIPISFSVPSLNAALYGAHLGKLVNASSITLVTVIAENDTGIDGSPIAGQVEERVKAVEHQLEELQVVLYEKTGVPTVQKVLPGSFEQALPAFINENGCDLVVMGVTHADAMETFFGTSHSIEVIKRTTLPVLVVPEEAQFTLGFNKRMDVSLLVDNHYAIPFMKLEKWLGWLKPKIYITHVNENLLGIASEKDKQHMEHLKADYLRFDPEIHFLQGVNFSEAVNSFVKENGIEMLFMFPARHSFFHLLFAGSHTKKLVFNSHVPVLCFPSDD